MAKDTLRSSTDFASGGQPDAVRDGTVTGASSKGYAQHYCDGSEYDKYGHRIDYSQLTAKTFK